MVKDYSKLPAKLTFENKGVDQVKIPLFRINDYAYIPAGDKLIISADSSEKVIFYVNAVNAIPNKAIELTIEE